MPRGGDTRGDDHGRPSRHGTGDRAAGRYRRHGSGIDLAREAAALVLLKDDFSSLLLAVQHGRRLFANLRKAIVFIVAVHVPIVGLSILPVLLGWPMLLMPVHILFLQMVIDPACSIVFEAEPIEAHAMASKPRRPDMHLFDREILLRGLLQGAGLLAMLVGFHVLVRWLGNSDEVARTTTFLSLVASNLGLIYVNRQWTQPSWRRGAESNRAFAWIGIAASLLLLLGVAAIRELFAFALPDLALLMQCAMVAVLAIIWFECVKWGVSKWRWLRGVALAH